MNLAAFAELAVRLVNSASDEADPLRTREAFCDFVADHSFLGVPVTGHDLRQLGQLRGDLAAVFTAAAAGDAATVAERLNALLLTHPLHPVIASHDGEGYHLHLSESGSACDRYGAAAVGSLAMIVTQIGLSRLGVCSIAACDRVFIDGSSNGSRRYCAEHSASRSIVAAFGRSQTTAAAGPSAAVAPASSRRPA